MWKKWRIWGLGTALAVLMLIPVLLLAGCSEKKVDYGIEGLGVTEASERQTAGNAGVAQFVGAEHWKDEWTMQRENNTYQSVSIDADIVVPEIQDMYVISASMKEFTESYQKNLAKQAFPEGEIYYYDLEHLPKNRLEQLVADCEDEELLQVYKKQLETAPDSYLPVEQFDTADYMGYRDGIPFELSFVTWGEENEERIRGVFLSCTDISQIAPAELAGEKELTVITWYDNTLSQKENLCTLTKEEAVEQAKQALAELGLSYSAYAYTRPLLWGTPEQLNWANYAESSACHIEGYAVTFDLGYDGLSLRAFGMEQHYSTSYQYVKKKGRADSMDAYATVYVTDKGVIYLEAYNPVEVEAVSQPVRLLPLATVQEIMRTQVTEHFDSFHFRDIYQLTRMELIYFRMSDRENAGHYSYIPVWRLSEYWDYLLAEDYNTMSIRNEVMVNAVDGSIVSFEEEYFGNAETGL